MSISSFLNAFLISKLISSFSDRQSKYHSFREKYVTFMSIEYSQKLSKLTQKLSILLSSLNSFKISLITSFALYNFSSEIQCFNCSKKSIFLFSLIV
jgi:hypothetical protein